MPKCNFIKEYYGTFREFFQKVLVTQTIITSNNVVHVQRKYETNYCLNKSMSMSDNMFLHFKLKYKNENVKLYFIHIAF